MARSSRTSGGIDVNSLPDWVTHSWTPDQRGSGRFAENPGVGQWSDVAANVTAEYEKRDTHLWLPLQWANPHYRRAAQGIGDCGSWGTEFAGTLNLAALCRERGNRQRFCELATESLYGLARVEVMGRKLGGYTDGSMGWANAQALRDYGALLRMDYSVRTGNPEHDLSAYNSKRAKDWGNYGCGGRNDKGALDEIARENPVKLITRCRRFDDIAAAVAGSRCPVTLASNYGCSMKRDKYGECGWSKNWSHLMCIGAVRFGKRPAVLICQSWGAEVVSGPTGDEYTDGLPAGGTPANIAGFTWWCPAELVDKILSQAGSEAWAIGRLARWKVDKADWSLKRFGYSSTSLSL
jgi:hypothetical protein